MNHPKSPLVLIGLMVACLGILLGTALWIKLAPQRGYSVAQRGSLEGMGNYGGVPEFSLVERSGKRVGLAQLRGTIWIADFIYTTCEDTCPMQTAEMARLQHELRPQGAVKLLSFSVDPEKDTPAVLSEYAARYRADAEGWLFLTGPKEEIINLVQRGFRLSAVTSAVDEGVIMHSPRFVLIDREAQIRGYYDSRDKDALQRLRKDVAVLAKRS